MLHNTNPPETATYLSQNMNQPEAATHQSVNWINPMGIFIPPPVSHTPYAVHYIPPVSNNLPPPPLIHSSYVTPTFLPSMTIFLQSPWVLQDINPGPSPITDFSNLLLGKDFLLTPFPNFEDRPKTFSAWSASLRSIVQELGVSPLKRWIFW